MDSAFQSPCKLSVSIVLYHSHLGLLSDTLDSLHRAAQVAKDAGTLGAMQVLLTDNSCDPAYRDSLTSLLEQWPGEGVLQLRYRAARENRGFGAGHNDWLRALDSDIHLILNPDVELDSMALQAGLQRLGSAGDIALLCPRVAGADGTQEFLCKRYPSVWLLFLRAFGPAFLRQRFAADLARYEARDLCSDGREADVELASGCFMLIPTNLLRQVEGFDARYFLYFEDFDLSIRLAREGRLVFFPEMQIVHHGGYAARKGMRHVFYFMRSAWRFFSAHGWRWI